VFLLLFVIMKRRADSSNDEIIAEYLKNLHDKAIVIDSDHDVWWDDEYLLTLHCLKIDPDNLPTNFSCSTTKKNIDSGQERKYQYDLRTFKKGRPKAYRVAFLNSAYYDNIDDKNTLFHIYVTTIGVTIQNIMSLKLWKTTKEGMDVLLVISVVIKSNV
jgi:hypothetical protein